MNKNRRHRRRKRRFVPTKVRAFFQKHDPDLNVLLILMFVIFVVYIWLSEGLGRAEAVILVFYYLILSLVAGYKVNGIILDATEGFYDRKGLLHLVIMIILIVIPLFALDFSEKQQEKLVWFILVFIGIAVFTFWLPFLTNRWKK